jgi:hypothetical protein
MKLLYDYNNNKKENNKNTFSKIAKNIKGNILKKSISNKKYKKIIRKDKADKSYPTRPFSPLYYNNINNKIITSKIKDIYGFNKSNKNKRKNSNSIKPKLYESQNFNKITVNLNPKNTMFKNKIKVNSNMKVDSSFTPRTPSITNILENRILLFSKKPTNGKNIASTPKTFFQLRNENNNSQIPDSFPCKNLYHSNSIINLKSNNSDKTFSNNYIISQSTEINDVVNKMNNKLQQFKANNSFYSGEKKNINDIPNGPEDFHYRFVELYRQKKIFYNNLKTKCIDKVLDIKDNNIEVMENDDYYFGKAEFEEYFENYEENDYVPYI